MTQRELEIRAFLHDIADSAGAIQDYVRGIALETYVADRKTRVAVEREFITIGEALRSLLRLEPAFAERIREAPRIISFRNSLTHGYRSIVDALPEIVMENLEAIHADRSARRPRHS